MGWWIAVLGVVPGLADAQGADLFYQRAVMQAADARCGLFSPEVSQTLAASAAQARGAALRAGVSPETLRATERAAEARAASYACAGGELSGEAQRLRAAFAGFARLGRISYPGDTAAWQADRFSRQSAWRLAQERRFAGGAMSFGLAGPSGGSQALLAVARFDDEARPYAARLVLRDAARTAGPYLDRWLGGPTASLPLERRLPPTVGQTSYMAEARASAGRDLTVEGVAGGWAFRFPAAAAHALAGLDPREAVAVDFLFPGGARRVYVEVGDFAAGAAFLQAGSSALRP